MRELISDGYGSIEYRYDCKNNILYGRLKFEYQHSQNFGGRIVGTKTLKIVAGGGFCMLVDFTPPAKFTWWHGDPQLPVGANEPCSADGPFPPSGVTVRIEPTPNPVEIEDREQCVPWDDFGDVYIAHQISFDKTPKATCDPDQPEAATACALA